MAADGFYFERNDSQFEETYTTPICPLSPLDTSPPPPLPLPSVIVSFPVVTNGDKDEVNGVHEMQTLMQSAHDLSFPLQDVWTLWYCKNDRNADWKDNLIELSTFATVENFWSVFNRLRPASGLSQGCDYLLFKKNIQPMWEDHNNRAGGRWCVNTPRNQRATELDNYWLYTLLSLIGDQYYDDAYNVNGCAVSIRNKGDRICLWTRNWRNIDSTKRIGSRFRELAEIPRALPLTFESHEDQESKRGASSKILFRA